MATTLNVGSRMPSFGLVDENGSRRSLPDSAGPNLLVFYRGDW